MYAYADKKQASVDKRKADAPRTPSQMRTSAPNVTGIPDTMKTRFENLSGFSFDDVRVHYYSDKPAQLQALAYTQGNQVHVGPGQEQHLEHELGHVVQQKQGRVKPTTTVGDVAVNDDAALEREADLGFMPMMTHQEDDGHYEADSVTQLRAGIEYETGIEVRNPGWMTGNGNLFWVKQDEVLLTANNWKIVSDNSKMEFVTDPPVEIAELGPIVVDMMNTINGILGRISGLNRFSTVFNGIGIHTKDYVTFPYSQPIITGSLQGTIGIPFHKLYDFFKFLTYYKLEVNEKLIQLHRQRIQAMGAGPAKEKALKKLGTEEKSGTLAIRKEKRVEFNRISSVIDSVLLPIETGMNRMGDSDKKDENLMELNKVKGLFHFIGQYAIFSKDYNDTEYVKRVYPLLARSSFSSMYNDLSRSGKRIYKKNILPFLQLLGITKDTDIFENSERLSLTIEMWLESIENPGDIVLPRQRVMKNTDKMSAPQSGQETDESMGAMGLDNGRVVIELRTIKHFVEIFTHDPETAKSITADLAELENSDYA